MWKLDLLHIPKLYQMALQDACDSHVIILSFADSHQLSPHLNQWIDQWTLTPGHALAMVALFDPYSDNSDAARTTRHHLSQSAMRAGVDFFAHPHTVQFAIGENVDSPPSNSAPGPYSPLISIHRRVHVPPLHSTRTRTPAAAKVNHTRPLPKAFPSASQMTAASDAAKCFPHTVRLNPQGPYA